MSVKERRLQVSVRGINTVGISISLPKPEQHDDMLLCWRRCESVALNEPSDTRMRFATSPLFVTEYQSVFSQTEQGSLGVTSDHSEEPVTTVPPAHHCPR